MVAESGGPSGRPFPWACPPETRDGTMKEKGKPGPLTLRTRVGAAQEKPFVLFARPAKLLSALRQSLFQLFQARRTLSIFT